jgi:Spy/CpxP family protein refolding chaperone
MMNLLKSLLLGLTMAWALTGSALAQDPAGRAGQGLSPEERRAHMEAMIATLELSQEQLVQFKALHADHMRRREALRAQDLPRQEHRTQARMLRKEHDQAMEAILTPEQYRKFLAKREEMRAARGGRGGQH